MTNGSCWIYINPEYARCVRTRTLFSRRAHFALRAREPPFFRSQCFSDPQSISSRVGAEKRESAAACFSHFFNKRAISEPRSRARARLREMHRRNEFSRQLFCRVKYIIVHDYVTRWARNNRGRQGQRCGKRMSALADGTPSLERKEKGAQMTSVWRTAARDTGAAGPSIEHAQQLHGEARSQFREARIFSRA